MTHLNTRFLLDEWRRQRGRGRMPARTQMTAAALAPLLPQVFVLGREASAWRFRLAGGFLCELHGRELRGETFATLWEPGSRAAILRVLDRSAAEAEPVTLHAVAEHDPARWLGLETTLAPLTGPTDAPDRIIGLHQPLSLVARLEGEAVPALRLAGVDGRTTAGPRLVVDNTRRVA
ncbi:MAG: PAS domain-containing protein [Caulobacteraceae bacterium]|nr:PAS domain-containing protein [Caulobacter sp.]